MRKNISNAFSQLQTCFLFILSFIGNLYFTQSRFYFCNIDVENFHYSLELLYLSFFAVSALLYIILLLVKKRNFDVVGMTFLFGTFTQMLLAYLVLQPILKSNTEDVNTEKFSFFITFVLFLLFQTLLTVRLLNEKR